MGKTKGGVQEVPRGHRRPVEEEQQQARAVVLHCLYYYLKID